MNTHGQRSVDQKKRKEDQDQSGSDVENQPQSGSPQVHHLFLCIQLHWRATLFIEITVNKRVLERFVEWNPENGDSDQGSNER